MPRTITIELPLPPKELAANARVHWRQKHRVKSKYRSTAGLLALSVDSSRPRFVRATILARFRFQHPRRRDPDNLLASLKTAFDSLVDAGILADDNAITHLPVEIEIGTPPGVTLVITEGP